MLSFWDDSQARLCVLSSVLFARLISEGNYDNEAAGDIGEIM